MVTWALLVHVSGLWNETSVPGENHKRRTCERRKGLVWNETHNLPALRPLNSKQSKQLSDWLVFYFIGRSFFFLKFYSCVVSTGHTHTHTLKKKL